MKKIKEFVDGRPTLEIIYEIHEELRLIKEILSKLIDKVIQIEQRNNTC